MRHVLLAVIGVCFSLACAKAPPRVETAPTDVDGAALYRSHCAVCHGASGHGDGPSAVRLGVLPPDLTTLRRRHGGTYPLDEVMRMIGGRVPMRGHGGPDMPVWGDAFLDAADGYDRRSVELKIAALAQHIGSLQTTVK